MLSYFTRFMRYPPPVRSLLIDLWLKSFWIDRQLKKNGLVQTRRRLAQRPYNHATLTKLLPGRAARYAITATRYSIGTDDTCLRRSLLMSWVLENCNVEHDLRVGLRRNNDALDGHAWIEINGQPLADKLSIQTDYTQITYDQWQHSK